MSSLLRVCLSMCGLSRDKYSKQRRDPLRLVRARQPACAISGYFGESFCRAPRLLHSSALRTVSQQQQRAGLESNIFISASMTSPVNGRARRQGRKKKKRRRGDPAKTHRPVGTPRRGRSLVDTTNLTFWLFGVALLLYSHC